MQPESIQGVGKGPAAGIAQWENYNNKSSRWAALNNFASSMGRNWTDLDAQLQFISKEIGTNDFAQRISGQLAKSNLDKAGTTGISFGDFKKTSDIDNATKQFEAAFERAGTPHMDRRIDAAKQYYKLFTGKDIPYTASSVSATSSDGENDVANGQKPTGIARLMSLVGDITSAIGGIFGKSTSSSTAISDATSTGSDVSGFSFAEGAAPVDFMKGILGKIQYSMTGPRDPEQGSADCSSTVQWAVKKATGLDIGSTTGIQYNSPNLTPVWYDNGNFLQSYPGNLQPNDVIFFQRKG
jgi:cell wall-associated NlpC family hydrolase